MAGRPNNQAAIAAHVRGLREAKAAFQALPQIVRERMLSAVETTVREIVRGAQARLQASPSIITRNLYNHVRFTLNKKSGRGRVGIASGETKVSSLALRRTVKIKGIVMQDARGRQRVDKPSRRAHFIEFGTRHHPAEPFMIPAAKSQEQPFLARAKEAGKGIEQDMAAIGRPA